MRFNSSFESTRSRDFSYRLFVFAIGLVGAKPSRIAHEKTVDNVARTRLAVTGPEALSILASKSATSRSVMASNGAGCSGAAYF